MIYDHSINPLQHSLGASQEKMSLWGLTVLVTGNLIGSGAFMLPVMFASFGSICMLGWVVTSLGAFVLSLIFSKLSHFSVRVGGPHTYVQDAFGPNAGFFVAWSYWVLAWMSNAGLVVGAISYLLPLVGTLPKMQVFFLEVSLIVILSCVNLLGLRYACRLENFFTLCKVIPLIALPLVGLFFIDFSHFMPFCSPHVTPGTAINATAYMALWCFMGLETGTVPGSEVINPTRNIKRAILMGTSLAAFVYMMGTIAIMGVVSPDQLPHSKAPYADLAGAIFGGTGWGIPFSVLASVACIGALNGWIMVVSRIAQGAAQDKLFPPLFQKTTKAGAPLWGTVISTTCTVGFLALSLSDTLSKQFYFILEMSVCLVLMIYLLCVLSYFVLLRKQPRTSQTMIGILGFLFCVWMLAQSSAAMFLCSLGIVLAGVPVWLHKNINKKI